jgi:hypothetical protein
MGVQPIDAKNHIRAVRLPLHALIAELREILGARLVAYIGSVGETRAVREWAHGTRAPQGYTAERLRVAFQVAKGIDSTDGSEVTQAWFQGLNPLLGDTSPARLLREGDLATDGRRVIAAGRDFLAEGRTPYPNRSRRRCFWIGRRCRTAAR